MIPNDHSTLEEAIKYLATTDFKVTDRAYAYQAKIHSLTPQALYTLVYNQAPNTDGVDTDLLTANKVYGPLTLAQKNEVYLYHQEPKTALIATLYNTNRQNIILAKRGEHRQEAQQHDYSQVTPVTANATHGPLSIQQKQEIYKEHQDVPAQVLAKLYRTNHQNVRLAQKQKHHGKTHKPRMTLVSKIKLTGKATWHDRTYMIVEALNNDPALIDEVLYYLSIGEHMPALVIDTLVALGAELPQELIADSMYSAQRIAYVLANNMQVYFVGLCVDYGATATLQAFKSEHLTEENIEQLYMAMTEMQGDMRSLNKAMRLEGIEIHNGTYKVFNELGELR